MRNTYKVLKGRVARLASVTGQPFVLEAWNPGDGARYKLVIERKNYNYDNVSGYMRAAEMAEFINGMFAMRQLEK